MNARLTWLSICALLFGAGCTSIEHQPREHIVKVVSDLENVRMYFEPRNLIIQPGDTVTWVNMDEVDHNVITYPDGYPKGAERIESPDLSKKGERWSYTFGVEGTYEYHCMPHIVMSMIGTVVVGRRSTENEFHEPSGVEIAEYRKLMREYFDAEEADFQPRAMRAKHPGNNTAASMAPHLLGR